MGTQPVHVRGQAVFMAAPMGMSAQPWGRLGTGLDSGASAGALTL